MTTTPDRTDYLTKHLFGAGVECPTKLFYKSQEYPEDRQSEPFIEHAIYNKRLLKALLRSFYPGGNYVEGDSIASSASLTCDYLQQDQTVLFNAIFEYQQMMARLPVVIKKNNQLTLFHVQTKAFDSNKHKLVNKNGHINSKWRRYLLDFAYQAYLVRRNWSSADLRLLLVMPEKKSQAHTDHLPFVLNPLENNRKPGMIAKSNRELLVELDVSELVSRIWEDQAFAEHFLPKNTFEKSVEYLRSLYLQEQKEAPEIGGKCKNCEFRIELDRVKEGEKSGFNECWESHFDKADTPNFHVFDLIGPGTNQLIEQEVYDQRNISEKEIYDPKSILKGQGRLSHKIRQSLQILKAKGENIPEEIFRPPLFKELSRWQYPLHFLDFEAGNYAVPVKKSRSPYHLVVFQFSCHTLYKDGSWTHHQWIDDLKREYPNYELVRKLSDIPGIEEGTIVQYSNFERNALKVIRRELNRDEGEVSDAQQLIEWIENIVLRKDSTHHKPPYIADLSRQVKNFYYNREMENSLSIKDVLQSVMSHSEFLQEKYAKPYSSHNFDDITWWQSDGANGARNPYEILAETGDSPIKRGTEAMVVYGKMIAKEMGEERQQAYQSALLKYCELDTLAMVMIYQHWKHKMTKHV